MGNNLAKRKKLTEENFQILEDNTNFSRDQISEWHKGFMKDCSSGKLSKKKFVEVYKQFYPVGKADKFCEHVFRTFDTDSSGEIDFVEFLIAISITSHGEPRKKLNWAFNMYDIDGNGQIDKNEMLKIILAIYDLVGEENRIADNAPMARVDKIFEKMDTNHDGVLSKDEFIDGCLQDELLKRLLAPSPS
ncbi:hypothetical protein SNEBB_002036 [Seison nebaliae]|nr:hypothetical protein SNEBB_002036 [Seison nebaliae]